MSAFISSFAGAEVIDTKVVIDHSSFTLISSRRVTRTVSEYTIRAVAKNLTAIEIKNVTAKIIAKPANITVIDGNANFGLLPASASVASTDEFTLQIDVTKPYSLADLKWEVNGDLPPTVPMPSEVGIFMSIDKNAIKGDVSNQSHKDWIKLLAWSEGSSNAATTHQGSGGIISKFNLGNISASKYLDSASLPLRMAIVSGRYFEELKIDVIKACGGNRYTQYAITLNQVLVIGLNNSASGGQDHLVEQVTFNTASVETMYTPVGKDCRFEKPIYSLVSYN
jgi:type VI secretion system Hcp family effector